MTAQAGPAANDQTRAFTPSALRPAAWLAAALNRLLAAEPWALDALRPHTGKVVRFSSPPFDLVLRVLDTCQVAPAEDGSLPDVQLELPLASLPPLAVAGWSRDDVEAVALRHVRVSGDAEFAQVVSRLARSLRWDAEEDASRLIGDAPAHWLFSGFARAGAQVRDTASRLVESVRDHLVVERPTLVAQDEARAFAHEVRRLREDLDRLDKRVVRLTGKLPSTK